MKPVRPPVAIVDYDPLWPRLFEGEKTRILAATGNLLLQVEHIGSTAVPHLAAKPTIDIMAAVQQLSDSDNCIEPLERIGYEYVPEHEQEIPERRYFRKGPSKRRSYHLHIVEITSEFWSYQLLFRDYLRRNKEVANDYQVLKRRLAAKYGSDRRGYSKAKTKFIERILTVARKAK
jgi:GrpB-like predicted nucleotidyltransferase (UPF0157 family)